MKALVTTNLICACFMICCAIFILSCRNPCEKAKELVEEGERISQEVKVRLLQTQDYEKKVCREVESAKENDECTLARRATQELELLAEKSDESLAASRVLVDILCTEDEQALRGYVAGRQTLAEAERALEAIEERLRIVAPRER